MPRWPNSPSKGLSPRVRGNPGGFDRRHARSGSIPACTGEPGKKNASFLSLGVYPRVYGGTTLVQKTWPRSKGLSPRVRGNPRRARREVWLGRSIPACTGEPVRVPEHQHDGQVYPRVYGGTAERVYPARQGYGLSPRVRGNRPKPRRGDDKGGSIPACTGEPLRCSGACNAAGVYPRVYGGTITESTKNDFEEGLSPRVRGNPTHAPVRRSIWRSIPACTGEPCVAFDNFHGHKVYPRVYGGTLPTAWAETRSSGLSPRVRGNLSHALGSGQQIRSIPACTGEPMAWASW